MKNRFFGIKQKLILSTAGLTIATVIVLSSILLLIQYMVIVNKTNETSRIIASGISSITIEGILQNKRNIIKDYVINIKNSKINGLQSIKVNEIKKTWNNEIINYWKQNGSISLTDCLVYNYNIEYKLIYKGNEKIIKLGEINLAFVKKEVFSILTILIWVISGVTLLVIVGSVYLMYRVGNKIVQPILHLDEGMQKVKKGNLSIKIDVSLQNDEISRLSESFNELITHFREKLQMQKFVSTSTVEMIKKSNKDVERSGERKEIVVFFSDIRGFTSYSETHEPEEVVHMLNKYLDLQTQIILKNGGDVDKYVGDEIFAIFSDCDKAIKASTEIQKAMFNSKDISVGIGINCGLAIVGSMGASNRLDFTAIGDTVNVGARLCSNAIGGQILLTKSVFENLKNKSKIKELDPMKVKNKVKPIQVYSIR